MPCEFGQPLTHDDLLSAIDHDATPQVEAHLAGCSYCAGRRDQIAQFEARFVKAVHHPSRQTLLEYHFNLLPAPEADQIGLHLDDCAGCVRILQEYAQESDALAVKPTPRAKAPMPAAPARGFGEWLRDAIPLTPLHGYATLGPEGNTIAAGSAGLSLFLNTEPQGETYTINGQVLTQDTAQQEKWKNAVAALIDQDSIRATTMLNERGQFSYEGVAPGRLRLRIRALTGDVVLYEVLDLP